MTVPGFAAATPHEDRRAQWKALETTGYLLLSDSELGVAPESRSHISATFFQDATLEADLPSVHADRERSRDVVRYEWNDRGPVLTEHGSVALQNRSGYAGERSPKRVHALDDPHLAGWISAVLALIPPPLRYDRGTFGVNFFRTRTSVVSKPHRDDENMCVVYVLDKVGTGARTQLFDADKREPPVLEVELRPGDILIFDDERFLHYVSPLVADGSGDSRRDALVCTIDYPDTYGFG
jgi:hypothetical protein